MSPATLCGLAVVVFAVCVRLARWPLPASLLATALVVGIAGTAGFPFRHFVEGGFGYLNLILALFAGAWFAQTMRLGGFADSLAARVSGASPTAALGIVGGLLFVTGMFVGIAGVAVLVVGAFAKPILERLGLEPHQAAAFIAIEATCGMIAPPINLPAMMIADGVNMPFLNFARTLLAIALPVALFAVWVFARRCTPRPAAPPGAAGALGFLPLALVLGFWLALRTAPGYLYDPGVPIVLVVVAIAMLPRLDARARADALRNTFSGVPVLLAAALVAVGILVQIMTLTGMRGWLVMQTLASEAPWLYVLVVSMPILGGVLTAAGAANVLGVPFAFAFIEQDMIINVAALSSIAAIAEFTPPTAIAAALAAYLVGADSLWRIFKAALPPLMLLFAISLALLVWAKPIAKFLTGA